MWVALQQTRDGIKWVGSSRSVRVGGVSTKQRWNKIC